MYLLDDKFWSGVKKMIPINNYTILNYLKKTIPKEVKEFELASLTIAAIELDSSKKALCFLNKCAKCPFSNKLKTNCTGLKTLISKHKSLFKKMPITWQHLKANEYGLNKTNEPKENKKRISKRNPKKDIKAKSKKRIDKSTNKGTKNSSKKAVKK